LKAAVQNGADSVYFGASNFNARASATNFDLTDLKEAISYGDLSENSEYDSAKNEQAELEERILKLENMIRKAKIINEQDMSSDQVSVGLKVKVKDIDAGDEMEFTIVGSTEADPFNGRISNESEVGKHLLGKKKSLRYQKKV